MKRKINYETVNAASGFQVLEYIVDPLLQKMNENAKYLSKIKRSTTKLPNQILSPVE